jgi:Holliday junction resolvase
MKGLKAEKRVAFSLKSKGANVFISPGSRGSADVIGKWNNGKKWFVQVKYSGKNNPANLSLREKNNLISKAKRNNGTAVLAQVTPKKISYFSVKKNQKLKP